MASDPLPPQATNPPLPMGPPTLPKIARRKTIDYPLMPRRPVRPVRPVRQPAESRVSSQSASIPAKPSSLTAATAPPETFDPKDWTACRLVATKKSLLAGQRHHVMRLHPKQYIQVPDPTDHSGNGTIMAPRRVNVTDPGEFKRPIRLHRRDPTAPLGGVMETEAAKLIPQDVEVDKEKEKLDALKAEKARVKAEQLSKIAPGGGAREREKMAFIKKTQQVHQVVDPANRRMRYEEQLPWFIEDYDNTNTWQGQREHAMSGGVFVVLMLDGDTATFSMIPVEKWYKFTEIKKFNKLSEKELLAVEKKRKEAGALPSWVKSEAKKQVFEETEELTAAELEAYSRNVRVANPKRIITSKGQSNKNTAGDEELDYNEERFDDDDMGAVLFFEGNEDEEALKEVEARIKKEQLSANVFDIRTELDYEDEAKEKKKLESLAKTHGKKLTKALKKREGNNIYESDSDKDPYAPSEESEDEDELFRKSELKKEEAAKKEATEAAKLEAAKQAEAKKDAAKKQREAANKMKQKKVKESSATPAVAVPRVFITPAVSKSAGKGKGNKNTTLPSVDTGGVSKKRRRSPTPPESGNDAKKQRQDKVASGVSGSGDMLEVPGKKLRGNKKSPGPSGDNLEASGGGSKNKNKRKFTGENDGVTKNKKQKPVTPPVGPTPPAAQPTTPLAIADKEIIALLRAYPEGISIKSMANTFKSRLRTGTNDVAVLAGRLKQFGKADENKVFRLRAEFV